MLASLKKAQANAQKRHEKYAADRKAEKAQELKDLITRHTKILSDLKSKGWSEYSHSYGFREAPEKNDAKFESEFDAAITLLEACTDETFVLDIDKDRSGLAQAYFRAMRGN
jgi:hypothetical protein